MTNGAASNWFLGGSATNVTCQHLGIVNMGKVSFTKAEKDEIIQKIQVYFSKELNQEIGSFDAGFLLSFFVDEVGPYFYNTALRDAQAILTRRMDDISNAIEELIKPTSRKR